MCISSKKMRWKRNDNWLNSKCRFCHFSVCYASYLCIFPAKSSATGSGVATVVLLSLERGRIRKLTINCRHSGQKEVCWNNIGAAVMSTCHVTGRGEKKERFGTQRNTDLDWWIWGIHLCQLLCRWMCSHVKGLLPSNHLRFEFQIRSRACAAGASRLNLWLVFLLRATLRVSSSLKPI